MKQSVAALLLVTGAMVAPAQTTVGPPGAAGQGRAGVPPAPPVASLSQRPTGAGLNTIRAGGENGSIWFGWPVAIRTAAFPRLTFSDALAKADTLGVTSVVASSSQRVSPEVPKNLDYRLQQGERNAVSHRMRELSQRILAYRVDELGGDITALRNWFEFAKAIAAPMIITSPEAAPVAALDKLANEFQINVALESRNDPKPVLSILESHSNRIGIAADLGGWMQAGIKPVDGLALVKDRLMMVSLSDRSALGAKGKPVPPGDGVAGLDDFFLAAFRAGLKPLSITVEATGMADTHADLRKCLNGFETVMLPAMAARVRQVVVSPQGKIRGPERLQADMKHLIDAAAPREAIVKPKKPRKLLVTDLQMYSGHETIPHGNLMLELMGKYTGAFKPTFSNDLDLLRYPRIREFDAIFLNNVCGMVHNDPEVRESILRFVREGGGIGGNHAVTYANNNWPEFAEMRGGWAGAHRTEKQVIKVDSPNSPLTKSFGSESFEHFDEFYQFPPDAPYSREKLHVLLSIDVERSDRAGAGRFCAQCTRPDQDYGLAWIRSYGKGRAYFTPLGHTAILYTDKRWTHHILAAVQFILGDLEADKTPSARLAVGKQAR